MASDGGDPLGNLAGLKPEELDFLAAVAKRAFQSVLRHPEPIYLKTDEGMRKETPKDKLYVASFAFELPDPEQYSKEMPRTGGKPWSPIPYKIVEFQDAGESWDLLPRTVEDFIQEGKKIGASVSPHFVLLNELSHAFEAQSRLASKWTELARTHKAYIVPGTFHCTTEFFGVAPIYSPDPRKPYFALKHNSAVKQQERIRTPDTRELMVFETDFGNIIIWICLDMYDPGLVLKFLNITHRFTGKRETRSKPKREISLVLVPAYSRDSVENIENSIRTISRFSKTAIVCANSYFEPGVQNRKESHGFSCGLPLDVILQKDYFIEGVKEPFCKATLYGVSVNELGECQAANYEQNGIFSSAFSAIINGGPYVVRDVPD